MNHRALARPFSALALALTLSALPLQGAMADTAKLDLAAGLDRHEVQASPGREVSLRVSTQLRYSGSSHFAPGSSVSFSLDSRSDLPTGAKLSTMTLRIPSNWSSGQSVQTFGDLTFTAPKSVGTYNYKVRLLSNPKADGLEPLNFKVIVSGAPTPAPTPTPTPAPAPTPTPAPTTTAPPVITALVGGALGQAGWYTSDVSLSWNVSSSASFTSSGCSSVLLTSDTTGTTFTCSATNAGGTSSNTVTLKRDATLPNVTATVSSGTSASGWSTTAVTINLQATDASSGVQDLFYQVAGQSTQTVLGSSATIPVSGQGQTVVTYGAHDLAGNVRVGTLTIKIDSLAPTIVANATGVNTMGWASGDVVVSFSCYDATSGVATCSSPITVTGEGRGLTATGVATDFAGNTSTLTTLVNIDRTAPSGQITTPANGATYKIGEVVRASFSCSDTLSGFSVCSSLIGNGALLDTSTAGVFTFTVTITDRAGNTAATTSTYTVAP